MEVGGGLQRWAPGKTRSLADVHRRGCTLFQVGDRELRRSQLLKERGAVARCSAGNIMWCLADERGIIAPYRA